MRSGKWRAWQLLSAGSMVSFRTGVPAYRRDLVASAIFDSGLRADQRARMTTST